MSAQSFQIPLHTTSQDSGKQPFTAELLRQLVHYDPETGVFTRRDRPDSDFRSPGMATAWRKQFLGKPAGSITTRGYRHVYLEGSSHIAHRLAWLYMTGRWPSHQIDHRDGNRANNVFANLRDIPGAGNQQNTTRQSNNTSGYTGVFWVGGPNPWRARIKADGRYYNLGCFSEKDDARRAYLAAKAQHHHYQPVPRDIEVRA